MDTDPFQWEPQAKIDDADPEVIRVAVQFMRTGVEVKIKLSEAYKHDSTEPEKFNYDYRLTGDSGDRRGVPFLPDVALKTFTWTGGNSGRRAATIIRVP